MTTVISGTGTTASATSGCPELDAFAAPTSTIEAHLRGCAACRVVAELVARRHDAGDARADCERYENLLAARDDGPISTTAAGMIDAHLATCAACSAVANTMAPRADVHGDHSTLPAVATSAYALGREVARGGMGRIFAARDLRIGRDVAVKELLGGGGRALAARFEREARVTARLQHPGIVPIYEIGTWPDGTPFYTMRMVEGRTLGAAIAEKPALAERLALLPSLIAAAEAIAFAHAHQVIHRDLTPANVLVGEFGETVVIDWGLAKDLSGEVADDATLEVGPYRAEAAAEGLTAIGAVIGTAAYMPPEQARGESVDERGDVYALGALLYQLLVGAAPYRAATSVEVVERVKDGPPPAIDALVPEAPRDLVSIAHKAMARDPAARYASAGELAAELVRFQAGRIVEAHSYSRAELLRRWLRRHRAAVVGAAAALVALVIAGSIGLTGVLRERDRADDEASEAIAARSIADAQTVKANGIAVSLLEEQGRQELLHGDNNKALAYLNAAFQQGLDTPALRFMLASALRDVGAEQHMFECGQSPAGMAISDDGQWLAASCVGGVRIWNISDESLVRTLPMKGGAWLRFSHDARMLVTYASDVRVWDVHSGAILRELVGHTKRVSYAAFTPDDRLVTVSDDGTARVWDPRTGAVGRVLRFGAPADRRYGAVSSDGKVLFTETLTGHGELWNLDTGTKQHSFDEGTEVGSASLSPDGLLAVACGNDNRARIWDVASGRLVNRISAHTATVTTCVFSPDSQLLLLGSYDGTSDLWDPRTGDKQVTLNTTAMPVDGRFSPDGARVALTGGGGIDVLATVSGAPLAHYPVPIWAAKFSRDGTKLLAVQPHGIGVWNGAPGLLRGAFEPPAGEVPLAHSPDPARALTLRADGRLTLWDVDARQAVAHFDGVVTGLAGISGRGNRAVFATTDQKVVVIDTGSGAKLATFPLAHPATNIDIDASGSRVLIAGDGAPQIGDVDHARILFVITGRVDADSLSPDGHRAMAWTEPTTREVWDIDAQRVISSIHVAEDSYGVGFDATGSRLAVLEQAGQFNVGRMGLWNADTGSRLLDRSASAGSFSPGGALFVTFGRGRLETWRTSDGSAVTSAQATPPGDDGMSNLVPAVRDDGELIATTSRSREAFDIRSARDGRVLGTFGTARWVILVANGGIQTTGLGQRWLGDGKTLISDNRAFSVWNIELETRSAAEIDRLVRSSVPWRVVDGQLEAISGTLAGRVTHGGKAADHATVTARLQPMGNPFTTVTSSDGSYSIAGLPSGVFAVTAAITDLGLGSGAPTAPPKMATVALAAPVSLDLDVP